MQTPEDTFRFLRVNSIPYHMMPHKYRYDTNGFEENSFTGTHMDTVLTKCDLIQDSTNESKLWLMVTPQEDELDFEMLAE